MMIARVSKPYVVMILFVILTGGCKVAPEPIAYGSDNCHFCRMTIVDRQHAAELVTDKGKVFKFDAVECMLNHVNDVNHQSFAIILVNGYTRPGELINASGATYLISEGIPSPMGAFLTAFEDTTDAREAQIIHGGQLYAWQEIKNHFEN
jgi:copper chaperone NosL